MMVAQEEGNKYSLLQYLLLIRVIFYSHLYCSIVV